MSDWARVDLYLPGTARYTIESIEEGEDYHHTPAQSSTQTSDFVSGDSSMEPIDV